MLWLVVYGLKLVYESLLHYWFFVLLYCLLGGMVYCVGMSVLYMSVGNDWGIKLLASFFSLDVVAHVLYIDL